MKCSALLSQTKSLRFVYWLFFHHKASGQRLSALSFTEHMSKTFCWWSQWRTSCLPMSGDDKSCVHAPKMHNPTRRRWPSEKHLLMTRSRRNNASGYMQLLCDIQTNCLLVLDARARVTAAHWVLCVWTVCDVHNFYRERFHGKHGTGACWHYREAVICGSSIFKNAVWSLYILFIRHLLKESRGIRQLPPEGNVWCWTKRKWKTLKAAQRWVRLHKQVTVYILRGGNKERSREASKDVTIFYLVCSHNGGKREREDSTQV